jgi:hypothetical protein
MLVARRKHFCPHKSHFLNFDIVLLDKFWTAKLQQVLLMLIHGEVLLYFEMNLHKHFSNNNHKGTNDLVIAHRQLSCKSHKCLVLIVILCSLNQLICNTVQWQNLLFFIS